MLLHPSLTRTYSNAPSGTAARVVGCITTRARDGKARTPRLRCPPLLAEHGTTHMCWPNGRSGRVVEASVRADQRPRFPCKRGCRNVCGGNCNAFLGSHPPADRVLRRQDRAGDGRGVGAADAAHHLHHRHHRLPVLRGGRKAWLRTAWSPGLAPEGCREGKGTGPLVRAGLEVRAGRTGRARGIHTAAAAAAAAAEDG